MRLSISNDRLRPIEGAAFSDIGLADREKPYRCHTFTLSTKYTVTHLIHVMTPFVKGKSRLYLYAMGGCEDSV
ncbi:hypothetical protein D3C73_1446000 [compost metagenome]